MVSLIRLELYCRDKRLRMVLVDTSEQPTEGIKIVSFAKSKQHSRHRLKSGAIEEICDDELTEEQRE